MSLPDHKVNEGDALRDVQGRGLEVTFRVVEFQAPVVPGEFDPCDAAHRIVVLPLHAVPKKHADELVLVPHENLGSFHDCGLTLLAHTVDSFVRLFLFWIVSEIRV